MSDRARGCTLDEAAERLTLDRRTLQRMEQRGEVRVVRFGRRVVVPESEVLRLLGEAVEGGVEVRRFQRTRKIKLYQRASA